MCYLIAEEDQSYRNGMLGWQTVNGMKLYLAGMLESPGDVQKQLAAIITCDHITCECSRSLFKIKYYVLEVNWAFEWWII